MSDFPWWHLADCRGVTADVFFEEDDESRAIATALCRECGVRKACRREALVHTARLLAEDDGHLDFGFQGGLSVEQRQRICSDPSRYSETDTEETP